jgi:NADP-dependent 3-hydroxy acid dehydrogenase YdfG
VTDTEPPVSVPAAANDRPVALVTGATRGIGRAIAADLGRTHHVLVGGRDADAVAAVVAELPSAEPFVGDLGAGDLPAVPSWIDVLVHSAGVEQGTRIADTPRDTWEAVFATNVFAVAELTRVAMPGLRAARGLVVTINSGSARVAVCTRPRSSRSGRSPTLSVKRNARTACGCRASTRVGPTRTCSGP